MPNDPWMPGLIHDPGKFPNYEVGRNRMEIVKVHWTAGTNSYGICKNNGLCQWLLPKVGVPWQFAPADGLCYDSGPFNDDGPGIEWERLGTGNYIRDGLQEAEPLTPDQLFWGGRIVAWLHDEWGVPLALYDGPRYGATQVGFRGFVNHGDLDSQRSDGVTREEWDALTGDDMTPEEHAWLDEVRGILTGGGVYPSLEARIESEVRKIVAEELAKLPSGAGAAGGPLTITLSGTAKPG